MTDDARDTPNWFGNGTADQSDAKRSPTETYGQEVSGGLAADQNWFGELELLETAPADASVPEDGERPATADGDTASGGDGERPGDRGGASSDEAEEERSDESAADREQESDPETTEPDAEAADDEPIGAGAVVDGESTPEPGAAAAAANRATAGQETEQEEDADGGLIAWLKSLFGM